MRVRFLPYSIPGVGVLQDVSGDDTDCLIHAFLIAAGHTTAEHLVPEIRQTLVDRGVTGQAQMLNLVNVEEGLLFPSPSSCQ